jgi:hypothetical protein
MRVFGLFAVAIVAASLLAGCGAMSRSSGVMQLGPDTYRVSAGAPMGDVSQSQKAAFTEAQGHCTAGGKQLMTVGTRRLAGPGGGSYEVTFRCLASGDPDLQRPNMQPAPTSIIQIK